MNPAIVERERAFLIEFIETATREPTSRELVDRARKLGKQELSEMTKLIDEMFAASTPLALSNQTIMSEMKEACRISIRRFDHLISREYSKEEFDNLPKPAQADMRRVLQERQAYFHALIERYGKY